MENDDKDEFSYRGVVPSAKLADLNNAFKSERNRLGDDKFKETLAKDQDAYATLLTRIFDVSTAQAEFLQEATRFLNTATSGDEYIGVDSDENEIKIRNMELDLPSTHGEEVSGKQAQYMVLAKGRNIKRFNLYNSGFYIVLRAPSLGEINTVYNQINDDLDTYGKLFGVVFFMYSDYYIKSILWDFIFSLVLDSNLTKWNKGNRLQKGVSFLDFNPILLNIGQLMFNQGYPMTHLCTNLSCKHTEKVKVDLAMLQLTDFSKIPQEQLKLFHTAEATRLVDALEYQDVLSKLNDEHETSAGFIVNKKIPSMFDYITFGDKFNEQLIMSVQDIKDDDQINQYFMYNYSKLYFPWIRKVDSVGDDGEILFSTRDTEIFSTILDDIQAHEDLDTFRVNMNVYIQKSMVTQIAFPASPCEKCKQMPTNAVDGFIPFDAQQHFFDQLVVKLV